VVRPLDAVTLRDWIASRAPAALSDESEVVRLEVVPSDCVMSPGETQQLVVRAHYADGRVRDVTWLAQFFSNDETTVPVKASGLVKSLGSGEAGVRVHFQGLVAVVGFTVPLSYTIRPEVYMAQQTIWDSGTVQKSGRRILSNVYYCCRRYPPVTRLVPSRVG